MVTALRFGIRPGAQQQLNSFQIVVVSGPLKRGRAVRLGSIDINMRLQDRVHRVLIVILHRVNQLRIGGKQQSGRQENQQTELVHVSKLPKAGPCCRRCCQY